METWAFGYALVRGYPAPARRAAALWMAVGRPGERGRYVLCDFSPADCAALAGAIREPEIFIEVPAPREAVAPLLPPGWTLRERAYLMDTALASSIGRAEVCGYAVGVRGHGAILAATAFDRSGEAAAEARCGLHGDAAVFDRVATQPAHRRRGLGAALMTALSQRAAERGAARGVLIATPDGRRLYEALGWSLRAEVTSAISPPKAAADGARSEGPPPPAV